MQLKRSQKPFFSNFRYIQYLATFPEEDQLEGITKLPHMSPMDHSQAQFATGMKQSSVGIFLYQHQT